MKKLLLVLLLLPVMMVNGQSITSVYSPKFVQGVGSGSPSSDLRVHYVCRMTVSGLTPNATYRYFCAFIQNPASIANGAAGAMTLANQTGNFTRILSPSVNVPGEYGEFTTNGSGSFTGWYIMEPSSDIIFTPGNNLFFRLNLNNGAGGVLVTTQLTSTDSIKVINWGTTSGAALEGSAIYNAPKPQWVPRNFVMLYDNIAGTGRPVTGAFIENDGTVTTTTEFFDLFYELLVEGQATVWASIIPNNLANGINNISQYALSTGNFVSSCTSPNGVYGSTDTRNADKGDADPFTPDLLLIDCTPTVGCSITLSSTQTNVLCFGASTGAVNLTVTGGTAPFTYAWTGPGGFTAATEDITGLIAGTYTVTVTDANSCTSTRSVTITQPASAVNAVAVATSSTCGNSNGSVDLTVSGGISPYTFAWTGPGGFSATTEDISGLAAGTYNVTVTDANGCTKTTSAIVTNIAGPAVSVTSTTNVLCFGGNTGAINITVTGGTTPYGFAWTGPGGFSATTEDINGLIAGTYTITVTDANSCTATTSVTITQPGSVVNTNTVVTNATCGAANGSVNLTVSGGVPPYNFAWTGPGGFTASTEDISGLAAGVYNVTVTDANGCIKNASATVNSSGGPVLTVSNTTQVLCFGANTGAINISVTGGVSPYTYAWTGPGGFTASTEDISGLAAGTYTIIVTDAASCTSSLSVTITQPAALIATTLVTAATCNAPNGSINLTVNGGTPPYTYAWTGPGGFTATTEDISALAAGTYSVTVTDANGCITATSAVINNIAGPGVSVTSTVNVLCFGGSTGSINITITGGVSPYSFSWTGPGGFTATTEDISGLAAGLYFVTVTDANGCIASTSVTINQPELALNASAVATDATCGAANGSVDLTVSGGTPSYTYAWTGPGGFTATTQDISGLIAGTYNVTITDANSCSITASASVSNTGGPGVTITGTTNVLCFNANTGAIDISVSGGTPPYIYNWTGPGGFTATTEDISGLVAGTYNVTVTDDNNCTAAASATLTQPGAGLNINAVATNATCDASNGSIDLTVNGGTSPYAFAWTGPGGFTAITEDISGLAAGTYNVTITDANGCSATSSATVSTVPGPAVTVTGTTPVLCFAGNTGAIDITVSSGTSPYTFAWTGPAGFTASTEDINGLIAGTYNVTITDANNCTATASATITQPASAVSGSVTTSPATCGNPNGSIDLTVSGGTSPYTYAWTGPGGFTATTQDIAGLAAGTYNVIITDANGCSTTATATVNNIAGPAVTVASITHVLCFAGSTGAINITVTGGTAAYSFSWTGPGGFTATIEDISGLTAGVYTVTVTDANGCTATTSATVNQPTALTVTETHTAIACFGGSSTITINATGGTAPYTGTGTFTRPAGTHSFTVTDANGCTFTISVTLTEPSLLIVSETHTIIPCFGGNSTITINATGGTAPYTGTGTFTRPAGTYSFTVTDANGCTATTSVTVSQPALIIASSSAGNIACNGGTTTVTVTATGGTAPYTGTGTFTRSAGTHHFNITDANGCTAVTSVTITQPSVLAASSSVIPVACNGGTATITITATGGTAPYTGTGVFTRSAGTYSFTVTDANGCSAVSNVIVSQPTLLTASASAAAITICGGSTLVTVSGSGGTAPYTYPGAGDYIRAPGTWNFTVRDAAGCTATAEISIAAPECLKVYPNPAGKTITVSHSRAIAGTHIQVFHISGSLVLTQVVPAGNILTTFDLRNLAAGIYILCFYHNGGKEMMRFEKLVN